MDTLEEDFWIKSDIEGRRFREAIESIALKNYA